MRKMLLLATTILAAALSTASANADQKEVTVWSWFVQSTMQKSMAAFEKALSRAFAEQRRSPLGAFELPASRTVAPTADGIRFRAVDSKETGILRHIENNVDLDIEMGKMAKNGGLHNLAATLLSHQFVLMREAISERVIA